MKIFFSKYYFQSTFTRAPPINPIIIGLNLEISSGKNGVKLYPIYDKPKSAIANIISKDPMPCIIDFIFKVLKKKDEIQVNYLLLRLYFDKNYSLITMKKLKKQNLSQKRNNGLGEL